MALDDGNTLQGQARDHGGQLIGDRRQRSHRYRPLILRHFLVIADNSLGDPSLVILEDMAIVLRYPHACFEWM